MPSAGSRIIRLNNGEASFTLLNKTGAYAEGDLFGSSFELENVASKNGGFVRIDAFNHWINTPAIFIECQLLLFDTDPLLGVPEDQAAMSLAFAVSKTKKTHIDMWANDHVRPNRFSGVSKDVYKKVKCKSDSKSLFGAILISAPFTAALTNELEVFLYFPRNF